MCKFIKKKSSSSRIDYCIRELIKSLNIFDIRTKASCCGHGKYPMTIIAETGGDYFELVSGLMINRTRNFYTRDEDGYYFIPETL